MARPVSKAMRGTEGVATHNLLQGRARQQFEPAQKEIAERTHSTPTNVRVDDIMEEEIRYLDINVTEQLLDEWGKLKQRQGETIQAFHRRFMGVHDALPREGGDRDNGASTLECLVARGTAPSRSLFPLYHLFPSPGQFD